MSERYTKLFTLPNPLYATGAPVFIAAGALLKDNQTGKVLAQLKFENINRKIIKALTVRISPLDTLNQPLGEDVVHQYLDLSTARAESFGQKSPVVLPIPATRAFSATVEEVIFHDNSVWTAAGEPWERLPKPVTLETALRDPELVKQFRLAYGQDCRNMPTKEKDLWYCACGKLNRDSEHKCYACGKAPTHASDLNLKELGQEKANRMKAESSKKTVLGIIAAVVVLVIAVAAFFGVQYSRNMERFEEAMAMIGQGYYEGALLQLQELGSFNGADQHLDNFVMMDTVAYRYQAGDSDYSVTYIYDGDTIRSATISTNGNRSTALRIFKYNEDFTGDWYWHTEIPDYIDGTIRYSYSYDNEGRITEISLNSGTTVNQITFSYTGNMVTVKESSIPDYFPTFTYDEHSNLTHYGLYRNDGSAPHLEDSRELEYDNNDRLTKETQQSYQNYTSIYTYFYNDQGDLQEAKIRITEPDYDSGGTTSSQRDIYYTYGENSIRVDCYTKGKGRLLYSYQYEFDVEGRLVRQIYTVGDYVAIETYTYGQILQYAP